MTHLHFPEICKEDLSQRLSDRSTEKIVFWRCIITDEKLECIAEKCPNLEGISFRGCPGITEKRLSYIKDSCNNPKIRVFECENAKEADCYPDEQNDAIEGEYDMPTEYLGKNIMLK